MDDLNRVSSYDRKIIDFENLGVNSAVLLGKYNYRIVKEVREMHRHKGMMEICFLSKGEQFYKIENTEYSLKGGDGLIIFPNQMHGTGRYPESKSSFYWFIFSLPENGKSMFNLSLEDSTKLKTKLLNIQSPYFRGKQELKNIFESIFKICSKSDYDIKNIEINSLLIEFLLRVINYSENILEPVISEKINNIINYIDEHITKEIEINDLAKLASLSVSHFKYRFKKETGFPPAEFILSKKIDKAKELLKQDSRLIKNIAYDLNFSSSSYFSTVFKRFTGKRPGDFIKE